MRRVRLRSENTFHALRGLVIQISANPQIDNRTKVLKDFGSGGATPVYVDDEWWIVYRVDRITGNEVFSVLSIWDAGSPPHIRL